MDESTKLEAYFVENLLTIKLRPDGGEIILNSFKSISEYLENEISVWNNYASIINFSVTYRSIQNVINTINGKDINQQTSNQLKKAYNDIQAETLISSRSNLIKYAIHYAGDNITIFSGIYNYYFGVNSHNNSPDYLFGQLLGFFYKDLKRIEELRKDFISKRYESLIAEMQNKWSSVQAEYNTKITDYNGEFLTMRTTMTDWIKKNEDEFTSYFEEKKKTVTDLEKTYEEKLRIDGPSKYWKDFRDKYTMSGIIWVSLCVLMGLIISGLCLYLLKYLPEKLFIGDRISLENTIRWTILFALITSTSFYLFRLFMKLALSSLHLSRDANERLQLTHQYLSLLRENAIDEKQRDIILQSLFSRADTGLLKGDSSPTMPDSVINQIIKNFSK